MLVKEAWIPCCPSHKGFPCSYWPGCPFLYSPFMFSACAATQLLLSLLQLLAKEVKSLRRTLEAEREQAASVQQQADQLLRKQEDFQQQLAQQVSQAQCQAECRPVPWSAAALMPSDKYMRLSEAAALAKDTAQLSDLQPPWCILADIYLCSGTAVTAFHHCCDTRAWSDMQAAELRDARETQQHLRELLAARPELQAGTAVAGGAAHARVAASGGDLLAAGSGPQQVAPSTEAQAQASPAAAASPLAERGSGADMPDSMLRGAALANTTGPAAAPEAEAGPDAGDSSGRASAATGSDQSSSAPQLVPEPPADSAVAVSQVGRCAGPCGRSVLSEERVAAVAEPLLHVQEQLADSSTGFHRAYGSAALSSRSQLQACRDAQPYSCH